MNYQIVPAVNTALSKILDSCIAQIDAAGILPQQPLLSAVSGGPDSLALAVILHELCQKSGRPHSAVIIDHGLRSEARQEAEEAAKQLAQLGISSQIKTVNAPRPNGGLQEFARRHRLALLAEAGRAIGGAVCFGHHNLDQAETIYMRLTSNSGMKGLAGMPKARIHDGCLFVRPLLEVPPKLLADICRDYDLVPARDPSNDDRRFERVRARQHLRQDPDMAPALLRLGAAAASIAATIDVALRNAVAGHLKWELPYFGAIKLDVFLQLPDRLRHRCLSLVVQKIGRNDYMAQTAAITRLDTELKQGRSGTLGGCLVRIADGYIRFERDARHLPEAAIIRDADAGMIFDKCWLITGTPALRFTALGAERYAALPKKHRWRRYLARWPYQARLRFPVVDPLDGKAGAPHFSTMEAWTDAQDQAADQFTLRLPLVDDNSISSWDLGQELPLASERFFAKA